eukprot:m.56010 g.56010  ORF g.56010 m.56010 type:complete len:50 (-) comp16929_c0_seq1:4905-5054(-)
MYRPIQFRVEVPIIGWVVAVVADAASGHGIAVLNIMPQLRETLVPFLIS